MTFRLSSISPGVAVPAMVGILLCALAVGPASAQTLDFREPGKAPPSWLQFAKLLQYRFEEWVGSDDPIAARFRVYLKAHAGTSDGPPSTLTVRAWVNPDGTVGRVAFAAFADAGATEDLRTVLTRGNVGEAPPPEMLQPINLRFSLNRKK
ncbi:hypothetical protein [Bradyrhizobium sp. LHD-71]|uniref:hypothetical protein n=1 Tax=Bradyrhizobium sp. LHD-71 TaxID=3072141 RepID=UPI00280FA6B6|nr:hypothetical protein [Bradyrhizobium sp. LHD-71]MDQ8728076.1 hypothetical protein [Bradyrhizobium sp. LHD-71]